jgi:PQQ-dependent catabolism-associated beta-propeller protein
MIVLKIFLFLLSFFILSEGHSVEKVIVSNEKSNTLSILSKDGDLIKEIGTCGRPRGMHFSKNKDRFFVGCADDDLILIYETNSLDVVGRIRNVLSPETFDLDPSGKFLVVSNEDDAKATVWNWEEGKLISEFDTGEEPEGVQITNDGKYAFVASEVSDIVHVLNLKKGKLEKNISVDRRPRRFALSKNEEKLFVSAELGSIVNIIDTKTLKVIDEIIFLPKGFKREEITPVDVILNSDSTIGYVALGIANHVGVFDPFNGRIIDYILVGRRAWGMAISKNDRWLYVANGLSDDISIIDTKKKKVIKSVKVGLAPYAILIVE